MADVATHRQLAGQLWQDMERARAEQHWPVLVDAGFYAVFHTMEALNALDCRDAYSFADAVDILERALAPRLLGEAFVKDYEYLFYFRRGALYGAHFPSPTQLEEFVTVSARAYAHAAAVLETRLGVTGAGNEGDGRDA
jgi:hypothetical protein